MTSATLFQSFPGSLFCALALLAFAPPSTMADPTSAPPANTNSPASPAPSRTGAAMPPLDFRQSLESSALSATEPGTWETPWQTAPIPFDELIYHWVVKPERGEGLRLYLQVAFAPGDESPWLYAGSWGKVNLVDGRKKPRFDRGILDLDQLLLKQKAHSWRFRAVSEGDKMLSVLPSFGVITTDNSPTSELLARWGKPTPPSPSPSPGILNLPHSKQADTGGNRLKDRCQSAALASAMQYFGTTVPLEQIIPFTTDFEYKHFGIWPRTLGAAHEFGFEAYIDRFRTWDDVRRTLAENKVILCSITMPKNDTYIAPPYGSIGGHIVALNGITDDGRVVVTDSTITVGDDGYLLQWKVADFQKIWMRNKGGVGMVICPPEGAERHLVTDLPAFPDRTTSSTAALKAE